MMMFRAVSIELLQLGYSIRFRPGGRSMQPTIRDGEAITVEPVNPHGIKRGDILLYSTEAGMIVHRVVSIRRDKDAGRYFILRGDSFVSTDEPVAAQRVLGRVVSVEREGHSISLYGRRARIRHQVNMWTMKIKRRVASVRRVCDVSTESAKV